MDALVPMVIQDLQDSKDGQDLQVTEGQQGSLEHVVHVANQVRSARRVLLAGMVHQVIVGLLETLEQQDSLAMTVRKDLLVLLAVRVTLALLDQQGLLVSEEMMDLKDFVAVQEHKVSAAAYLV